MRHAAGAFAGFPILCVALACAQEGRSPTDVALATVKELGGRHSVVTVDLRGCKNVTPGALAKLGALDLRSINLLGSDVSDQAIAELRRQFPLLTDRVVEGLKLLHKLEALSVEHTRISEGGIKQLMATPGLRMLCIDRTQARPENVEQWGRPELQVVVED